MTEPKRIRRYSPAGRRLAWQEVAEAAYDWLLQISVDRDPRAVPSRRQRLAADRAVARVLEREHIAKDGRVLWDPKPPKETS